METSFRRVPVSDIYEASVPLSAAAPQFVQNGVRIPQKKAYFDRNRPVIALYRAEKAPLAVYFLVAREPRGYLFDHYVLGSLELEVSDEDHLLLEKEQVEVEEFLSTFMAQ